MTEPPYVKRCKSTTTNYGAKAPEGRSVSPSAIACTSAALHVSLGAKNPRLLEPMTGGDVNRRHYVFDFDSIEDWASFVTRIRASEWWATTQKVVADAHPNLRLIGQAVMTNAIA